MLTVSSLRVRYGQRYVVDGVSLDVRAGEIVALVGPNGAGKSTLLAAVAGVCPHEGTVLIDGGVTRVEARQGLVALADQPPTFYEFMTAEEFLAFVLVMRTGTATEPRSSAVGALVEMVDLEAHRTTLVRNLSFGNRQRLSLAAALAGDLRVVLLDESLNGLDPIATRLARRLLVEQAAAGRAILVATHVLEMASTICGRILFMSHGRLVHELELRPEDRPSLAPLAALEALYQRVVGGG